MAETRNAGAPDEASQGLEFRDGPEDMARMSRYEDYLRLQQRAEGMSNAEYLAELDRIMESGDGFDKGDTRYGAGTPGPGDAEADRQDGIEREERLRANLEDGQRAPSEMDGNAYLLDAGSDQPGGPNEIQGPFQDGPGSGTPVEQISAAGSEPEEAPEARGGVDGQDGAADELQGHAVPAGHGEEGHAAAESESWLGADPVIHDGPAGDEAEQAARADRAEREGGQTAMGDPEAPAAGPSAGGYGRVPDTDERQAEASAVPDGQAPADPEKQVFATEPAPGPADPADPAFAAGPAPGPAGLETEASVPAGPETYHIPGHVEVREEEFQTSDFLDEAAVATGLASSVQTAEYVPPMDVMAGPAGKDAEPVPARSEKMQELMAKAERDRERDAGRNLPDGPQL